MAIVTVTAASNDSLVPNFSFEDRGIHLRDASFSSYIGGEETFILKLNESTRSSSTDLTNPDTNPLYSGRRIRDGELRVFDAEKYFNGGVEEEKGVMQRSKKQGNDSSSLQNHSKAVFKSGVPGACSEASWNSQSALLPNFSKDAPQNDQKQGQSKNFFGYFGCKCVCSGKKSVDIDENQGENRNRTGASRNGRNPAGLAGKNLPESRPEMVSPKSTGRDSGFNREECFSFPILNPTVEIQNKKLTVGSRVEEEEARTPRVSLEAFDESVGSNLQKRLMTLTFENGREIDCFLASPAVLPEVKEPLAVAEAEAEAEENGGEDDDLGSDSSSDLFEIGTFSGDPHPLFRRNSDDMSIVTTTCYEPSEASIEWSVVTRSANNFSVASDYDDSDLAAKTVVPTRSTKATTTATTATTTKTPTVKKVRQGGLLACRSEKAVKVVAANACRPPVKLSKSFPRQRLRSETLIPAKKYPCEFRVADKESSHVQGAFEKRSLSRPHFAQVSNYISQ